MALLFLDGFDHYATTDANTKWNWFGSKATMATGRGGGGVHFPANTNQYSDTLDYAIRKIVNVSDTVIVGMAVNWTGNQPGGASLIEAVNGVYPQCSVAVADDGVIHAYRGNIGTGNSAVLGAGSIGLSIGVWAYLEVKMKVHGTAGSMIIRINGEEIINVSGVNTAYTAGITNIDSIGLSSQYANGGTFTVDDLYICDTTGTINNDFLGDIQVRTLYPTGAGANSQLTGSDGNNVDNYALIDEVTLNTADYVASATTDQKDTYVFGDVTNVTEVKGVQSTIMAGKSEAGSRSVAPVIRHGGVDYDGADKGVSTSPAAITTVFETNPGTGVNWTADNVNNAEFGVKVRP